MLYRVVEAAVFVFVVMFSTVSVDAVERITVSRDGNRIDVVGQALFEDSDGGMLLLANDGQMWMIQAEEVAARTTDSGELMPLSPEESVKALMARLGPEYTSYQTAHYIVVSNADPRFVQFCSGLFEKLYKGFYAFWRNNGIDLPEAQFPLVALVFDSKASFQRYARPEAGDSAESIIGYYNLKTNRMTTYDVAEGAGARAGVYVVDRNIATLVHEATHQLSYNCGLQRRYADNPYWVSEGMAVFFESPDLKRSDGWRKIGRINEVNRLRFSQYLARRPSDSLVTLIQDDSRFKNSATATYSYSEAWALTYFLIKTKSKQYVTYLEELRQGEYLDILGPRQRVEMFRKAFGDLEELDKQFISYTRRVIFRR